MEKRKPFISTDGAVKDTFLDCLMMLRRPIHLYEAKFDILEPQGIIMPEGWPVHCQSNYSSLIVSSSSLSPAEVDNSFANAGKEIGGGFIENSEELYYMKGLDIKKFLAQTHFYPYKSIVFIDSAPDKYGEQDFSIKILCPLLRGMSLILQLRSFQEALAAKLEADKEQEEKDSNSQKQNLRQAIKRLEYCQKEQQDFLEKQEEELHKKEHEFDLSLAKCKKTGEEIDSILDILNN